MNKVITETFNMIIQGVNQMLPISICAWLMISLFQALFERRRRPSLMMFAAIFYVGLLLWGTCLSRVDTLRELLTWQRSDFTGFFVNEFSLTSFAPIWHELMNVVLFVPLGFFMMAYTRGPRNALRLTLMGCAVSCFIELFQGFHGLRFDFGDLMTNTLGTLVGCRAYVPIMYSCSRMRIGLKRFIKRYRRSAYGRTGA